ncbi:hypothetical protein HGM15179_005241 [Zosterops borbonicus]|uniref:Uncharacterized protein n=1 Tax=Zosterops borbonicus TaxID=364589 RepID=A0A8K1GNK3_9PASS|nr:hypothetical protein HGM15179_005241 [Zosterops borbonicus]
MAASSAPLVAVPPAKLLLYNLFCSQPLAPGPDFAWVQFPVMPWTDDQYEYSVYSPKNSFSKALKLSIIWFPTPAQEDTTNSVPQETIHIPDYTYFG